MTTSPALHVAHGRGLPVPTIVTATTRIGRKSRESSAPPFLRRDPVELARLDAGPPPPKVSTVKRASPRKPPVYRGKPLDEATIVAQYRDGMGINALHDLHKTSKTRIVRILDAHGIQRHRPRGSVKFQLDDEVVRDYTAGMSARDVADKHGCVVSTVYKHLKAAGIPTRNDKPGEMPSTRRVFTADERAYMRQAYEGGTKLRDVATELKTGQGQVKRALIEAGVTIRPPMILGKKAA